VSNILPGTYTVRTQASGFKVLTQTATVSVGSATPVSYALEIGSGETVVDVLADSQTTIDPTDTKIDTNITKQVIEALPRGTSFTSLLKTAPNVRPEPLSGGFQIDGASGSENVFVIDGQEVTNFRTGTLNANNNIPFELVQEVQIKSTGFEAEYGGATGGVINVITVGGNDQLRGNFGISFRPSTFQGGPRPILQRFASTAGSFEYFQPRKDRGTDFFPTASLQGPIVKGKLWFSAIYAPQIFETSRTVDYFGNASGNLANPTGRFVANSIEYRTKQYTEQAFARIDAQPTSKLRMYGTFLYNPIRVEGALPAVTEGLAGGAQRANFGGNIGVLTGADFLGQQGGRQNSNNVNGQVTYTATNNFILNARAGRSFLNEKLGSYGIPNTTRVLCSTSGDPSVIPGGAAAAGCTRGEANFATNFQIDYDVSTRTTFDADASLVGVNLGGRHNFKFGYQYNGLYNTTSQGYANTGQVVLYYGLPIADLLGTPSTPGNLGSGLITRFGTIGEASSKNQGVFVQDSWQIGNRLTLNLGLRAESEDVPSFNEENEGIKFGWGDKLAPRLGVAFDLLGNGNTKVFASYGWFYDRFKYELPRGSFGGDFFRRDYFEILPGRGANLSNYTVGRILGTVADIPGGNCPDPTNPNLPYPTLGNGFSICQFDFRIPSNSGAGIDVGGAVDEDIKAARQSEYTIGLEHQLMRNMIVAARFTHKQVDYAIEDIGIPTLAGSEAYIIGNPGFGLACEVATANKFQCTEAERNYDAFEIRLDKRATNYFFNASYTLSKLFGNYSGLASSDEAGRTSPNVSRLFDLPFVGYTANGKPDNGRLATDRPHVFKAFGGYTFNWFGSNTNSTTVSAYTSAQSGTPLTSVYTLYAITTSILNGRGDLGRTKRFTETDLYVSHNYKFGRDNRFRLEPFLSIRNLFNEDNELGRNTQISTSDFRGGGASANLRAGGCPAAACANELAVINTIFNGGGIANFVTNYLALPTTSAASGRVNTYGLANSFQAPRDVRFGFRLVF
jgi:hypothetical protein